MKITKIYLEDFLCLEYFKWEKLGKLNRITGGNGKGKSAIITGIKEAFKSSGHDPKFIKLGSDKAQLILELDSNIKIDRKITEKSTYLKVTIDDHPVDAPQTFLNKIFGAYNFNPIDFFSADKNKRREMLLSSMPIEVTLKNLQAILGTIPEGIDLTKHDYSQHGLIVIQSVQKDVYDYRHEINITLSQLDKSIKQDKADMPEKLDQDEYAAFDLNKITNELSEIKSSIDNYKKDESQLRKLRERSIEIQEEIAELESKLTRKKEELVRVQAEGKELGAKIEKRNDIKQLETKRDKLQSSINNYQEFEELRLRLKDIQRKETELEQIDEKHKELDNFYKLLVDQVPAELLRQSELPVESLEIKGDNILIDGKQIDKLSTSEQLRLSIHIARAVAGELKVICIDRFESLDEEARKVFEQECANDEFEYFITQVTGGDLKHEVIGELAESNKQSKPHKTKKSEITEAGF